MKNQIVKLDERLTKYADERLLDIKQINQYQLRITDNPNTVVDFWVTGKYHILKTNYSDTTDDNLEERQGEHGDLPNKYLANFLDSIFFMTEFEPQYQLQV